MSDLPHSGGCACGAVRFELDREPVVAMYCHCRRCQRRSGTAASPAVRIEPGSLRVTAGAEHVAAWKPEGGFHKEFCALCGSALWAAAPDGSGPGAVRMSAFDE